MDLPTLLDPMSRPCTEFEASGFRPTNEIGESWLGRVSQFLPEEEVPVDKHGNRMTELGQFYLLALPHVPASLSEVSLLTALISPKLEDDSDLMEGCFEIREYGEVGQLVHKEHTNDGAVPKPFPLRPEPVEADHPVWDGGGVSPEQGCQPDTRRKF